jgi:hypothetical protein
MGHLPPDIKAVLKTYVHALSGFWRVRMTRVACQEDTIIFGEMICLALSDDIGGPPYSMGNFHLIWFEYMLDLVEKILLGGITGAFS